MHGVSQKQRWVQSFLLWKAVRSWTIIKVHKENFFGICISDTGFKRYKGYTTESKSPSHFVSPCTDFSPSPSLISMSCVFFQRALHIQGYIHVNVYVFYLPICRFSLKKNPTCQYMISVVLHCPAACINLVSGLGCTETRDAWDKTDDSILSPGIANFPLCTQGTKWAASHEVIFPRGRWGALLKRPGAFLGVCHLKQTHRDLHQEGRPRCWP